jgi:hypothetical protein
MAKKARALQVETVRLVRIFVSSPGDVKAEREVLEELITRINRTDGQAQGVRLELWKWETGVVPQIGPPPQEVVDAQTPPFGIYLGIMSARFGTPTAQHGSGTEQEFRDAATRWGHIGQPWILFYFNEEPALPKSVPEIEQFLKVRQFRDEFQLRPRQSYPNIIRAIRESNASNGEKH